MKADLPCNSARFFQAPCISCINLFQTLGLGVLAQARDDYHHAKRLGGLCEESQHDFEELKLIRIELHLREVLSCSFQIFHDSFSVIGTQMDSMCGARGSVGLRLCPALIHTSGIVSMQGVLD